MFIKTKFIKRASISMLILLTSIFHQVSMAQVGIGTTNPDPSAILDVNSTTKGFLPPRMDQAKMILISGPTAGLIVYNTTFNCLFFYNGTTWVNTCTLGSSTTIPNLPANITLTAGQTKYIASVYDTDYSPYTPAAGVATTGALAPTVNNGTETPINIQGTLDMTNGITVKIPYSVDGGNTVTLPAFSQTKTVISAHVQSTTNINSNDGDGGAVDVIFSYPEHPGLTGNDFITATIKAVGSDLKPVKLDINAGVETDLGILLAEFSIALDDDGNTGNVQLKDIAGIPDRMMGQVDNNGDQSHNFLYLPVTNSTTGRTWLNNNLGASYASIDNASTYGTGCSFNLAQQATAFNDHCAYGSLFQWGRKADGHDLIQWTDGSTGVGLHGSNSSEDYQNTPSHARFIWSDDDWPVDWRVDPDDALWTGEAVTNAVCPSGFRLPTELELMAERGSWTTQNSAGALSSSLALTRSGNRTYSTGSNFGAGSGSGWLWSSDIALNKGRVLNYVSGSSSMVSFERSYAITVRCIQDIAPSIDQLLCSGGNNTKYTGNDLVQGEAIPTNAKIRIKYNNGNGGNYPAFTLTSTGDATLTASFPAGTLNGTVASPENGFFSSSTITGTVPNTGTATFDISFLGHDNCALSKGEITIVAPAAPLATITNLDCGGSNRTRYQAQGAADITDGVTLDGTEGHRIKVRYDGGTAGDYNGATINSTTVTGLTATLVAGTMSAGNGEVYLAISGTPSGSGNAIFPLEFLGHSECGNITVPVVVAPATITNLDCGGSNRTRYQAQGATDITDGVTLDGTEGHRIKVRYDGGTAGDYNGFTISSTTVTGLTATLIAGTMSAGNGEVYLAISGTPSGSGDAIFPLEFLGHSECGNITAPVVAASAISIPEQIIKANPIVDDNHFGQHVQVSADNSFMVVSSRSEAIDGQGALFTYTRNVATDQWEFQSKISPQSTTGHTFFGEEFFLSSDGQKLAVSQHSGTPAAGNQLTYSGQVFIYERTGNTFPTTPTQTINHPSPNTDAGGAGRKDKKFGDGLMLSNSGEILVIAAPDEKVGTKFAAGKVYIYEHNGASFTLVNSVTRTNPENSEDFGGASNHGRNIAISDDDGTIAIGDPQDKSLDANNEANNTGNRVGAVFVYKKSGGSWTQYDYIKSNNMDSGDLFGSSVGISSDGTQLFIGAYQEDSDGSGPTNNSSPDAGAAYEYVLTGSDYLFQTYFKAPNPDDYDSFGRRLIVNNAGDILCVTSPEEASNGTDMNDNSVLGSGATYIYKKSGGTWTMTKYLKLGDSSGGDGTRVQDMSEDGTKIFLGSIYDDSNSDKNGQKQL